LLRFADFFSSMGSEAFGLVGADEPRYAPGGARMLERSDWVTPTLQGKRRGWKNRCCITGSHAVVPRFWRHRPGCPSARRFDAALLVAAVYFFLRRFRPGSELTALLLPPVAPP